MIVDDEERAITGIKSLIDWDQHGVSINAEARDGVEALEILKTHPVDILLTDIRMPEMDGLTLISIVNEKYPHIKSIIMSGYDEFSYATKALTLGASDYLIKPSRVKEILDTILKLIEKIKSEQKQIHHLEYLKQGFRESLPLLREKTLRNLVIGNECPYEKLVENLKLCGILFPHSHFFVMVIQIDTLIELYQTYNSYDIELLKYGLKNLGEDTIAEDFLCAAFEYEDDIVIVMNSRFKSDAVELLPVSQRIKANASAFLRLSVSIGIGVPGEQIHHLKTSHMTAMDALDSTYYRGKGRIVYSSTSTEKNVDITAYPIDLERTLLQAVLSGNPETIREKLLLFQKTLNEERTSRDIAMKFTFSLFFALYRLGVEKDIDVSTIFGEDLQVMAQKLAKTYLDEIYREMVEIAEKISEELDHKKQSNKLFQRILEFIRNNFNKDLNRETVAKEVFITPGYLSLLFKQQLKISFLSYLHNVRIEQAAILLKDPGKRIGDIAVEVGYNDEKYFFQVFKKYTGMTPNQYRNLL
ncbi:response regulator [Paenibacillus sp. JNUCC31]|uniref:response regulator n=1 Tax=Paenibacillus sp. JNUCC-31 TaxID=2777983 RepID=UPI0017809BFD|nr:response regulator [Paenibacillus sp. JNUCC-31]QOS79418.1 response regulator [Paenibacillus sp. JNUCC-31]